MAITPDSAFQWPRPFGRFQRIFDLGFLIFSLALFIYCVADWQGWLHGARGLQPLRMVYLSGALALQGLAALIGRRSVAANLVLVATSLALLLMSALARN